MITEQEILELGFTKRPNQLIIDSYMISVALNPYEFKELSVTIQQGNQYVFIRQGSAENERREEDDVVTLFNGDSQGELTYNLLKQICEVLTYNNRNNNA